MSFNAEEMCKQKFKHLSNKALVDRANGKADFQWDDEGTEIARRCRESNGKLVIKMDYNTLRIFKDETVKK